MSLHLTNKKEANQTWIKTQALCFSAWIPLFNGLASHFYPQWMKICIIFSKM